MSSNDLSALFLGPKGENADVFERLLLEAFRDHVFWRRNFHPEDGFSIQESDKRTPEYEERLSTLSQELMGVLGELKAGVPMFSPRYIGHMTGDLSMAGLVGYFAAMLYNPNNVSSEASPVTTRLELEACAQLAAMIGYPAERHWSHLTSGGTVANFEALWAARSVKYLPVTLHWAAKEARLDLSVRLANGSTAAISELGVWELLNVMPEDALDAMEFFHQATGPDAEGLLSRHSLSALGHQEFGHRLAAGFGDALPPSVVLVPSTAHYSWEKLCRALGIGSAQLQKIPVDARFRMDLGALEQRLTDLHRKHQPVLAVVSVIGSTEESAVDRLDELVALKRRVASKLGLAFSLHADAAWGGYAAASTWTESGERRHGPDGEWPSAEVFNALCALGQTDSTTIDPHKLGFAPYPAGAVCFRDGRVRTLSSSDAPYVFHPGAPIALGKHILEGSRPGAAAAAVWMTHKAIPLNESGYGRLIGETVRSARLLHRALREAEVTPFRLVVLPESDINLVCFTVTHPSCTTLEQTNVLMDRLCARVSAGGAQQPEFVLSRTSLRVGEYGAAALPIVNALGFSESDYRAAGRVTLLRSTVMKPFPGPSGNRPHLMEQFPRWLRVQLEESLDVASSHRACPR